MPRVYLNMGGLTRTGVGVVKIGARAEVGTSEETA